MHQILLHLDCDGVDVFQLNDIGNLLRSDLTPKNPRVRPRSFNYCSVALRNGFHHRPTSAGPGPSALTRP